MSTLSSANVTDVNLVLKERTHIMLCINILIFTHNLGNWLIGKKFTYRVLPPKGLITAAIRVFMNQIIKLMQCIFTLVACRPTYPECNCQSHFTGYIS